MTRTWPVEVASTQKQIQTAYNMANTDLSAAWNENQWPATHWMSIQGLSQITVPAYWWNYTTWSGTWSGAASFLTTECGSACKAASLGVTRHEYHATPH